jgi:CubicO group peptidase (beta-lactamase class C family)
MKHLNLNTTIALSLFAITSLFPLPLRAANATLAKYETTYRTQRDEILGGKVVPQIKQEAQRIVTLTKQFDGALSKLQKSLLAKGDKTGAAEILAARKLLAASPEYQASTLLLGKQSPTRPKTTSLPQKQKRLPPALKRHLVLHYNFDSNERGKVTDNSSEHNRGKVHGAKWVMKGKVGGAIQFDGENDYIELSKSLPIGSGDNTVALWVRIPKVGQGNLKAKERVGIVLGNFGGKAPLSNWEIYNTGRMFLWWNNGEVKGGNRTDLRDGHWHHLAWIRNRKAGTFSLYVDSQLERTIDSSGKDICFASSHRIGADNRKSDGPCFHGTMDEFMVFNRALSQSEVRHVYDIGRVTPGPYRYRMPQQQRDGWQTANAQQLGVDTRGLTRLADSIKSDRYKNIHSVLLARSGKLVFEEYFNGFNAARKHTTCSLTKAITCAVVGIAIGNGAIPDASTEIHTLLPEYDELLVGKKKKITLEHLLRMTAGLDWDESTLAYTDPRNSYAQMKRSTGDLFQFILSRKLSHDPGSHFQYNSGLTLTLGKILSTHTGMSVDDFASQHLFKPLAITDFDWPTFHGEVCTSGGLMLTPRDVAKFGQLVLDKGQWHGRQIVPEAWIRRSAAWNESNAATRYGYHLRREEFHYKTKTIVGFQASGYGGQFVFLFPALDLVAVFTGWNCDSPLFFQPFDMLYEHLLPAVSGTTPAIRNYCYALPLAAWKGKLNDVKFLVNLSANIETTDASGNTPLICAALGGHLDIIELLISKGANVNATNSSGATALAVARQKGYREIASFLQNQGAIK